MRTRRTIELHHYLGVGCTRALTVLTKSKAIRRRLCFDDLMTHVHGRRQSILTMSKRARTASNSKGKAEPSSASEITAVRSVDHPSGKIPTHLCSPPHYTALRETSGLALLPAFLFTRFLHQVSSNASPSYRPDSSVSSAADDAWIESAFASRYTTAPVPKDKYVLLSFATFPLSLVY